MVFGAIAIVAIAAAIFFALRPASDQAARRSAPPTTEKSVAPSPITNNPSPPAAALKVFREYYPKGRNYLLSPVTGRAYAKKVQGLELTVCGLEKLE
jgi:hypothetical protein